MKNAKSSISKPPAPEISAPPAAGGLQTKKAADDDRVLRVNDLVKPHGILPVCRSTFLNWAREGRISPGIRLGPRTRVWKVSEIRGLIDRLEAKEGNNG